MVVFFICDPWLAVSHPSKNGWFQFSFFFWGGGCILMEKIVKKVPKIQPFHDVSQQLLLGCPKRRSEPSESRFRSEREVVEVDMRPALDQWNQWIRYLIQSQFQHDSTSTWSNKDHHDWFLEMQYYHQFCCQIGFVHSIFHKSLYHLLPWNRTQPRMIRTAPTGICRWRLYNF